MRQPNDSSFFDSIDTDVAGSARRRYAHEMKVTLFMAASLNGMIARPDYREDFLSRRHWDSFLECVRRTGALIWGRKTHEKVRKFGPQYFEPLKDAACVVVTTDASLAVEEGFECASSPRDAIVKLG